MRNEFEVSNIINRFKDEYYHQYPWHSRIRQVFTSLEQCRTSALGGHVDACTECGHIRVSYNSCRNRHCPKCQGMEREIWIQARKEDLLPVKYFHVVFTLPHTLNPLLLKNMKIGYSSLFRAAWETITAFAHKQKIQAGMICLLHTWGSGLQYHPHLHCIVPAGGINTDQKWQEFANVNNKSTFLFPVRAMSKVFRAKFMAMITPLVEIPALTRKKLFEQDWVVYSKYPFYGKEKVLEYIGRYSHRVAISNSRIKQVEQEHVSFEYKDYKAGAKRNIMKITGVEFLRRFTMHILPQGFVRIRHYGVLAVCNKKKIRMAQRQLGQKESPLKRLKKKWKELCLEKGLECNLCPECEKGQLVTVEIFQPSRPPPGIGRNERSRNFKM